MGLKMKYFVLKPEGYDAHAVASRAAMRTYAREIRHEDTELADQLENWANGAQDAAVALENSSVMETTIQRAAERREFLGRHVPRCPKCGLDHPQHQPVRQIQLIASLPKPAIWRCRICRTEFKFEPPN